ncbi:bidirectional sugar transporter SWEET2a-like isoform X2 [Coffea arabica]|uniref:Bidirectional sugar transporter SWEET2a-like isoform X2 n=1 Tax=Coffea arabica TaxID=13443 RepID=A0ABM4VSV5_COFAR|nr:bidirectional sugar transporter SWEET2a isoform X2 [Coffea arabica]
MLQKKIRKLRISLSCRNCNDQKFEKNIGKMMIQQTGLISTYSVLSYAAGVAGNFFAFVLFVSPMPTFRRIIRRQSTEQFSGLPYVYALLNCLICLWYGMPIISPGIILVATVNSVGAIFQMIYIIIFIAYAERGKKNLVIKTKSVEYMPFYLSLATFLMSLSFFGYGMFKQDLFISVPNGIGSLLGIIQLVLYFCYSRSSDGGRPRAPLLESYA